MLGWDKRLTYYYVRKLAHIGWIHRETRTIGSPYQVMQPGLRFLASYEKHASSRVYVRLEHCGFKYPVLQEPRIEIHWKKVVELRNWRQFIGSCCGLTIQRNPNHLVIYADVLEGENPFELLLLARDECDHLATYLESKFQMRLGRAEPLGNAEWAVWDPVAEQLTRINAKIDTALARLDRSWHRGEIDWKDPRAAYEYLTMPRRLARIEAALAELMPELRERAKLGKDADMRKYL